MARGGFIFALPVAVRLSPECSRTHLSLPPDLSFKDWLALGHQLHLLERAHGWWIGDWWKYGEDNAGRWKWKYGERKALVASAEWQGPSFQTCMNAANIARAFETSRRREVLSFTHHAEVCGLDAADADRLLDAAEVERWSAMELRAEVRGARAAVRIGTLIAMPLPTNAPVHVLYLDPPWQYENPPMGGGNRSIENHYPTMTLDELRALDVGACATDDAIMFMWATAPKLAECMTLIEPWRFEYRTNMVWDKIDIGMGYHARNQHELLLICKRGSLPAPDPSLIEPSIYRERRTEHSRKPEHYYEMIERLYPRLRKRELFSRDPARPGWEQPFGNQLEAA
jgi:N6-adenosine-specific RNA methylase IME4